jgi:mannose-6-phosphate isomerase
MSAPSLLRTTLHEKIWGSTRLSPWFPDSSVKIGEAWFEAEEMLPVLVKLLFTEERLSVQVHPGDEYAAEHENSRGKTEMWHVLRADPGAAVAVGLRQRVTAEQLRELAVSGEIEQLLNWIEVRPGDTVFVPAGTIHAIGPGLALCEIQQYSDVTYRLYDYGRGRELHLDRSFDVAVADCYEKPDAMPEGYIAYCPYFAVRRVSVDGRETVHPLGDRFELFIALRGDGSLAGQPFRQGEVWHVPPGSSNFDIESLAGAQFLRVHVP